MIAVSICIPTFNQVKYLTKTLDSIFEQKNVDYEVVITDDSTNDDVEKLVENYIDSGRIIRYFRNTPSLGSPINWNYALSLARGEYVKIMHHDEWFIDNYALFKLYELIKTKTNCFVFSAAKNYYHGTSKFFHSSIRFTTSVNREPEILIWGNYIGGPSSILFKNEKLDFDANLIWLVDIDFYIRLLKKGNEVLYIDDVLYASMIDSHNLTNSCINDVELQLKEYTILAKKYLNHKSIMFRLKTALVIFDTLKIWQSKYKAILLLRILKRIIYV